MSTHALIALALLPWLTTGTRTTGPAARATVTPTAGSAATATLGEESFGNDPVLANEEWAPGVLAVANDPSRVYRRWINGN